MCLAVPLRIISITGSSAIAEAGGLEREVRIDFLPGICPGDFVMVHAGFAIEKIDPEQAQLDREAWEEVQNALS